MLGLLADEPTPAPEAIDASAIADDYVACWCNNVTAGEIRELIRDGSASNLAEVQRQTRATGGCGKCLDKVTAIVDLELTTRPR